MMTTIIMIMIVTLVVLVRSCPLAITMDTSGCSARPEEAAAGTPRVG